jgi:hypothetical protein
MPIQLFTAAERVQRNHFPEVIAYEDLVIFFPLSASRKNWRNFWR